LAASNKRTPHRGVSPSHHHCAVVRHYVLSFFVVSLSGSFLSGLAVKHFHHKNAHFAQILRICIIREIRPATAIASAGSDVHVRGLWRRNGSADIQNNASVTMPRIATFHAVNRKRKINK
jgi:hypothetical protein